MTAPAHWFEPLADHMGSAYLRYSFTKGTENEVEFLWSELGLEPGMRVLDVGCGPGRHAHALARRGVDVLGVDISSRFVELACEGAPPGATFERRDARDMDFDAEFDAAFAMCQGAFGMTGGPDPDTRPLDPDREVLAAMARAVGPGGLVGVSAFSAYFRVANPGPSAFDALTGVDHERTQVRDDQGRVRDGELWTTCYTPRELRLMAELCGLDPVAVHSVTPGDYRARRPTPDTEELFLVSRRAV